MGLQPPQAMIRNLTLTCTDEELRTKSVFASAPAFIHLEQPVLSFGLIMLLRTCLDQNAVKINVCLSTCLYHLEQPVLSVGHVMRQEHVWTTVL